MRNDQPQHYIPNSPQATFHNQSPSYADPVPANTLLYGYKNQLRIGFIILLALVGGLGMWATFTKINGAVVTSGFFVVESKPKSVQHLNGGIIDTIFVSNGDHVEKGDLLISLDTVAVNATLENLNHQDIAAHAKIARLEAERKNKEYITWPKLIRDNQNKPEVKTVVADQLELFRTRKELFAGRVSEINSSINQRLAEFEASQSILNSKIYQQRSLNEELHRLKILQQSNAVSMQRVAGVEREVIAISGEIRSLKANLTRFSEQIADAEAQRIQLNRDKSEQILLDLTDLKARTIEVQERLTTASEIGRRSEILAPSSGIVHNLKFTTTNGIIPAGQEILQIIPVDENLVLEARIAPNDIDQIYENQKAVVTLSAFHPSKVPQLNGQILKISADLLLDDQTATSYYSVAIGFSAEELKRLKNVSIVPGMPAVSFIQTQETTVLRYILKPITTALSRSFREE